MNLLVQILANRAQRVLKNTDGESNLIFGLAVTDRMAGSASSSNFDGTGETDRCLVVVDTGATVDSMEVLGGDSGRRDDFVMDKIAP